MARIPYADPHRPEVTDLADRIVAQRGSLLHLYRMLMHSGPVAEGWLTYLTAIRYECSLPGDLRELAILRIAHLNGAPYEAEHHVKPALQEGVTQAQIDAVADWVASPLYSDRQRAVLAYTDAMTREIKVPDAVFEAVRRQFDERLIVELTATIGAYNMVSRFLEALAIRNHDPV